MSRPEADTGDAYQEPLGGVHGGDDRFDLAPIVEQFKRLADGATSLRESARPCADCGLYIGHRGGCAVAGLH